MLVMGWVAHMGLCSTHAELSAADSSAQGSKSFFSLSALARGVSVTSGVAASRHVLTGCCAALRCR